jgi:hypothetical protein
VTSTIEPAKSGYKVCKNEAFVKVMPLHHLPPRQLILKISQLCGIESATTLKAGHTGFIT